jgi:hypothetical protein
MSNTIFDVLEYGPICAADEDSGALVTINGSYVNLWMPSSTPGQWVNTDCVANDAWGDLYNRTAAAMIDRAEECLKHWLRGDDGCEGETDVDTSEDS